MQDYDHSIEDVFRGCGLEIETVEDVQKSILSLASDFSNQPTHIVQALEFLMNAEPETLRACAIITVLTTLAAYAQESKKQIEEEVAAIERGDIILN